MAEEFPLSDEKLDELFVKNIGSVTRIVENLPQNEVTLPTCTRWFKIFEQAKHDEKLARNFMLLLMHKQLNDKSTLSYPFTDARSCQNDLKTLHKMSMRMQKRKNIDEDGSENCYRIECSMTPTFEVICNNIQQLIQLKSTLTRELQTLQSEKERLLQRRHLHLTNIKMQHDCSMMCHKEISYMKNIFACSAITALKVFDGKSLIAEPPRYFITLFNVLCENQQTKEQIRQLDERLGKILRDHIDHNTRKSMRQQMSIEFDALRAIVSKRYKKIIENQKVIQSQELSLSGMNYLMMLKKLFFDSFKGDEHVKSKGIKFLQNEYNGMDGE